MQSASYPYDSITTSPVTACGAVGSLPFEDKAEMMLKPSLLSRPPSLMRGQGNLLGAIVVELEEGDAAAAIPEEADLLGPDFIGWHQRRKTWRIWTQSSWRIWTNTIFISKFK